MELYRNCSNDCSYFTRVRTIAEKAENIVDTRTPLLCIFQNACQQRELYFLTCFILESVLKRVNFVNIALIKLYNYYHNVKCDYSIAVISLEDFSVEKAYIIHREYRNKLER